MSPIEWVAIALIIGLVAVVIFIAQRASVPANNPRAFLRRRRGSDTRTVIVCAGDSITHGIGSANYVTMLEKQLGADCEIVNAGINGNLAWNVAQRLPDIIACEPDVVTLLIGTNDVNATMNQDKEDHYRKEQRIPEKPTLAWYRENVEHIIDTLQARTRARIAVLTIPMLGEVLDSDMNQRVNEYNAALASIAQAKGITLLPLHDRLCALIPPDHAPLLYDGSRNLIGSALFKHYLLGQSWDDIAKANGFVVLTDHIHLSDRAANIIAKMIVEFVKQA